MYRSGINRVITSRSFKFFQGPVFQTDTVGYFQQAFTCGQFKLS